jgi:hypothetical protein
LRSSTVLEEKPIRALERASGSNVQDERCVGKVVLFGSVAL